ncbi:MAG TPA: TonB-dependent receptor [Bryobacteraceae bacterium]|nr:TonB-dependent receptor [Bryobacteraceae bacterium]
MTALTAAIELAQLTSGVVEGAIHAPDGRPLVNATILITGGAGFRELIRADPRGEFTVALPSGRYRFSSEARQAPQSPEVSVFVGPLQTLHLDLAIDTAGAVRSSTQPDNTPGAWSNFASGPRYPEAFSLQGLLLSREPSSVTEPLNFTGLSDNRLALESQRAFSWTDTQYKFEGMDATDSWQPGLPVAIPDQAVDSIVVREGFEQTASSGAGAEVGVFLAEPPPTLSNFRFWNGALWSADGGGLLSSANLPPPAYRGSVQQADRFRWLTRDGLNVGGMLSRRADLYLAATGQWASQTAPLRAPGTNYGSRVLTGNARVRIRVTDEDRIEAVYSGSRIDLADDGLPTGIEALTGNRMMPYFALPGGFSGQSETDHLDLGQLGWTRILPATCGAGILEVRYGASTAHLDTTTDANGQSRIELLGGAVTGPAPLANLAVRSRQEIAATWQPAVMRVFATRNRLAAGGGWKTSEVRNRFTIPSDMNLITADGAPAFVVDFNTPLDSREIIRSFSAWLGDHMTLASWLDLDLGVLADFSHGSLPAQSSPGGHFVSERSFTADPDLIAWRSVSPRVGLTWEIPHSHGLIVRSAYARLFQPLAGRYLDFGNPNALGGAIYQWNAANSTVPIQPVQQGNLLVRFGGPYSTISPSLHRPYVDEINVGAQFPLSPRSAASIHLFRRDSKDRIAAIDVGVPATAFTPISILDPGPDGIPGTFDDQRLVVYAQNPGTLGQDRYLLTNPAGLRMLNMGLVTEVHAQWRGLTLHASFVAEKSYGPTNPGNGVYENDPGIIGALFLDPNTLIHAAGRTFMDRAYVGKVQATYRLPPILGRVKVASIADYMDGLVFARQLLVNGLPQGPFLVATTVRGSPEGGNRAQYAINWNLGFSREFEFAGGRFTLRADILNVTNAGQRIQENDLSGPSFNLRLPVAIQPARFTRIGFTYEF